MFADFRFLMPAAVAFALVSPLGPVEAIAQKTSSEQETSGESSKKKAHDKLPVSPSTDEMKGETVPAVDPNKPNLHTGSAKAGKEEPGAQIKLEDSGASSKPEERKPDLKDRNPG